MRRFCIKIGLIIGLNGILIAGDQQLFDLGDFKLESGAVILDCHIGYRTFGRLNAQKTNAILYPTWLGGTSRDIGNLIGTFKLIDTTRYCIIAVDALSNGVSSSPSNSRLQPGAKFPPFNIRDLVQTQYRLVTEKFGLKNLYAIIGGSLGSFQGFEWIVNHPDFSARAVLYLTSPQLTTYDLLEIRSQIEIIESGRRSHRPDEEIAREIEMITELLARSPDYRINHTARSDFNEYWDFFINKPLSFSVDDRCLQLKAIMSHDIAAPFAGSLTAAAQKIKARTLIIVNRQDRIVNCRPALDVALLITAETLFLDSACGHLAVTCEIDTVRQRITRFLNQ